MTVTRAHYQLVEQGRARGRMTREGRLLLAAAALFLVFVLFLGGVILGWLIWLGSQVLHGWTGW